jgi:hypothetical protein
MDRSDGGLDLKWPGRTGGERTLEHRSGASDRLTIPARSVLVGQGNRISVLVDAGVAPRVVQEEEREQPCGLGLLGVRLEEGAREPDREPAEVRADRRLVLARPVAFVEEQVNGAKHRRQAREAALGRGPLDVALFAEPLAGAREPLLHAAGRDDERTRDLIDREPDHGGEGERRALPFLQCRMAAAEEEPDEVVLEAPHHLRVGNRDARPRAQLCEHVHGVAVALRTSRASLPIPVRVLGDRDEPRLG